MQKFNYQARMAVVEYDHARVVDNVKWGKRWGQTVNGLYYGDELAGPDGVHLELYATPETTDDDIREALASAYRHHDVVYHSVLIVPAEWIEEGER